MDTIQAAVLLSKLNIFEREVYLRQKIGKRYTKGLNQRGFNDTPFVDSINTSVYAQYTIQVDNRDKIISFLKEKGIPTSIHYPSLIPDQVALNNRKNLIDNVFKRKIFKSYKLENARNLVSKVLSLPMHPLLKEDDQDKIIDCLIDAIKSLC